MFRTQQFGACVMWIGEFALGCFAVFALFRFADGLESVARSIRALARAVGDED